jgi:hypothetical protein
MTTQRQQALARAIERASTRDLSSLVETCGFNYGAQVKYELYRRLLAFAKEHYDDTEPAPEGE